MNGYLIPANSKRGTLIFNVFRLIDLGIFSIGVAASIILLAVVPSTNVLLVTIALLPVCICGLLVIPVANYHNVLCALQSIYRFYTERRRYVWKGWCFYEQYKDEGTKK